MRGALAIFALGVVVGLVAARRHSGNDDAWRDLERTIDLVNRRIDRHLADRAAANRAAERRP